MQAAVGISSISPASVMDWRPQLLPRLRFVVACAAVGTTGAVDTGDDQRCPAPTDVACHAAQ
jgi:hypothetical protein